ncbi:hypothetical protein CDD81_2217 [Ophiocordyceps australis]|uniref:Protein kinase domain-containing protein n=1 Tax=Ophiocordyceps australis TaxID=1399860 RepID=A0A2C5XX70_9HYPO|nr:hypothetical protein CDD81_2217 [Ophiocordyceps australis]
MCAPNDVWSLGVILVNLTCGRNPWKQASFQDSTYRAYARSRDFLKTILPLSDELNDILGRIFHPSPEQRITLPELRMRIAACPTFTVPSSASAPSAVRTPPASPPHITEYVCPEDAIVDDYDYDSPLSPASTSSDEGSLVSSGSSLDDSDDEDVMLEQQPQPQDYVPFAYEAEDTVNQQPMFHGMDLMPMQYSGPVPPPIPPPQSHQVMECQQVSAVPCQPKPLFPLWEVVKYMQQTPMAHHPAAFPHPQMHFMPTFQGCY